MPKAQQYGLAAAGILALAVIAAASVLCALHDLDAQATVALFGTAVGLIGGGVGSLAAVAQTTNGNSVISNGHLAQLTATLQEAIHGAQAAPAQAPPAPVTPPAPAA